MVKFNTKTDFNATGLVPSGHDERDYEYRNVRAIQSNKLPTSFRLQVDKVRNQGQAGACVGFASAVIQECDAKTNGEFDRLSPLFIYTKCKELDGMPTLEGTNLRTLMKVLKDKGVCKEHLHPYVDPASYKLLKFPQISIKANADAVKNKITGYARVNTLDEVKQAVFNENGVIMSVVISDTFDSPLKGVIGEMMGFIKGYHAIPIIGWDDNMEVHYQTDDGVKKSKGALIFINSWGEDWGDKGYGYIPYAVYDLHIKKQPPFEFNLIDEAWTTLSANLESKYDNYHKDKWFGDKPVPPNPKPSPNPSVTTDHIKIEMTLNKPNVTITYPSGKKEVKQGLVPPMVINGSTLVPFRLPFEVIGNVLWNQSTKTASVKITKSKLEELLKLFN